MDFTTAGERIGENMLGSFKCILLGLVAILAVAPRTWSSEPSAVPADAQSSTNTFRDTRTGAIHTECDADQAPPAVDVSKYDSKNWVPEVALIIPDEKEASVLTLLLSRQLFCIRKELEFAKLGDTSPLSSRLDALSLRLDKIQASLTAGQFNGQELKEISQSISGLAGAVRSISVNSTPCQPAPAGNCDPAPTSVEIYPKIVVTLPKDHEAKPRAQFDPARPVLDYFPYPTQISFAIAAVPNPRVPRLRRAYDLSLAAISKGMRRRGFVLDSYSFPWLEGESGRSVEAASGGDPAQGSGDASAKAVTVQTPAGEEDESSSLQDDGRYGVMLFRNDAWRGIVSKTDHAVYLRAIYLVPEAATYGVARHTLECAAKMISAQVGDSIPATAASGFKCPQDKVNRGPSGDQAAALAKQSGASADHPVCGGQLCVLGMHPLCPVPADSAGSRPFVIFGPNLSGSIESLYQARESLESAGIKREFCLVSSAASLDTNARLNSSTPTAPHISFHSLASSTLAKIHDIRLMAQRLGIEDFSKVAFLAEDSSFGAGLCKTYALQLGPEEIDLCENHVTVTFPENIADIRYGDRAKDGQAEQTSKLTMKPKVAPHLSLEDGAENGSEFPESHRSPLTASGSEIELNEELERLQKAGVQMVVVAATDVRDRLFLFERIRDHLPLAQLVDLEADLLVVHPDFVNASRGALVTASVDLEDGCNKSADCEKLDYSTDYQRLLRRAVGCLADTAIDPKCPPSSLSHPKTDALQIAGRGRLMPLDAEDGTWYSSRFVRSLFGLLNVTGCVIFLWIWLNNTASYWLPSGWKKAIPALPDNAASRKALWQIALLVSLAPLICTAFTSSYDRHFMSTAIALGLVAGAYWLFRAIYRFDSESHEFGLDVLDKRHRQLRWAIWAVAVTISLGNAIAAPGASGDKNFNVQVLGWLSLDLDAGLAYQAATSLAVVTLLYACAMLTTAAAISNRNGELLIQSIVVPANGAVIPGLGGVLWRFRQPLGELRGAFSVAAVLVIIWVGSALARGDILRTIYGPTASTLTFVGLAATTLCAWLLCGCFGVSALRVLSLSVWIRSRVAIVHKAEKHQQDRPAAEIPGPWPDDCQYFLFPQTPVVAAVGVAGGMAKSLGADSSGTSDWIGRLAATFAKGEIGLKHRVALFAYLASEITLFRWLGMASVVCALAGVGMLYLFPITNGDVFVLTDMAAVVTAGLISGFGAVNFERDELLSNVLCSRPKKPEFSIRLAIYIAFPFAILAASAAVAQIPGVLNWSDGLVNVFLKLIGHGD